VRRILRGSDVNHPAGQISSEAYSRLLLDLEARLPVSVALGPQRAGALSGVRFRPLTETTVAEESLRLSRAVSGTPDRPGLSRILAKLAQGPHKTLETTEPWVPRDKARRPHPARLSQAVSVSGNLSADRRPERVLDTRVEHTTDVYENRLLKAYFHQVTLRLRRLIRLLEANSRSGATGEEQGLLNELLLARRQATFLDEVALPTHLSTRLTMVLLRRPLYRAALEGYLEFHRSVVVRLEEPSLDAPLKNLPYLYQTWGTLEILSVLLDVAGELGYRRELQRLISRDAGGFYVRILPGGGAALVLRHPVHRTIVKFIPERTYGRRDSALHSISYPQRPDVAVEVHPPHQPPRIYLFDPKYKLEGEFLEADGGDGKPKKVDIDKMHAYRDAIRDEEGRRSVRYAAVLYPGTEDVRYATGLEALRAYPGTEKALEWRIGDVLHEALNVAQ
jgi:predicted component of viral defense system (DUF524 family)